MNYYNQTTECGTFKFKLFAGALGHHLQEFSSAHFGYLAHSHLDQMKLRTRHEISSKCAIMCKLGNHQIFSRFNLKSIL